MILHVDMDAFFASVEQMMHPEFRGRPVIVGGDPEGRGVVSAASYEARRYGVHSAMPMAWARKLCPHGVYLRGNHTLYREISDMVFRIFESFTPHVEAASVDEAYLDITGCERLFGPPLAMAHAIRSAVWERLGLSCSVGIARTRTMAKIASDLCKPAGLLMVLPGEEASVLGPLPVGRMPGIGETTQRRLESMGIRTLGDLSRLNDALLERAFGSAGPELARKARGEGGGSLREAAAPKSMGRETTFERDVEDRESVRNALSGLVERVCRRLRHEGLEARTVTVKLRYADFQTLSRSRTFPGGVCFDSVVIPVASELFQELDTRRQGIRLIGVSLSRLQPATGQLTLWDAEAEQRRQRLYGGLDAIRDRFGFDAISAASRTPPRSHGPHKGGKDEES